MIVDFHVHILPRWVVEEREHLARVDPCFGMLYANPAARIATADDLIRSMDEAGIDTSVVLNIGWSSHELCVRTNDYLLDVASRYPKRVVPFCMVQPTEPESAVHEIERCARAGARGVGELRPDAQGYTLAEELLSPVVEAAIASNLVILPHISEPMGHTYPGKGVVRPEQAYEFAVRYPEARLVCAHWGGGLPFYELMPEVKKTMAQVYYDTAASPFLYSPKIYSIASEIVGSDKIFFGSDYPLISPKRYFEELRESVLSEEEKKGILGVSLKKLLELEDRVTH